LVDNDGRSDLTKRMKQTLMGVAALAAFGLGGAAIAGAASGGDDDATDKAIGGSALTKASAAALDHTGGGSVTETEAGDEEGAYEIEVKLDDGRSVDVHLDKNYKFLSQAGDNDKGGETNEAGDD